jgi:hypothetical protein
MIRVLSGGTCKEQFGFFVRKRNGRKEISPTRLARVMRKSLNHGWKSIRSRLSDPVGLEDQKGKGHARQEDVMRTETGTPDAQPTSNPSEEIPVRYGRNPQTADKLKTSFGPVLLLKIYLPPVILILVFFMISLKMNMPFGMFTRDPAEITNSSPFLGVVSNISILLWCSSAAICMHSFLLLRKNIKYKKLSMFFLVSSVITLILMFDDLFMLHEEVYHDYFHIRQRYVYIAYFMMILIYLLSFRKTILNSEYMPLVVAFILFGVSILVDGITDRITDIPFHHLFEDGPKFLGIAGWLGYFGNFSLKIFSGMGERSP